MFVVLGRKRERIVVFSFFMAERVSVSRHNFGKSLALPVRFFITEAQNGTLHTCATEENSLFYRKSSRQGYRGKSDMLNLFHTAYTKSSRPIINGSATKVDIISSKEP
jgi:hypothetical protein